MYELNQQLDYNVIQEVKQRPALCDSRLDQYDNLYSPVLVVVENKYRYA